MYVVTLYSFKGGVGRTMALVNIGVALASLGRRVLLVDFDLEAPGIPTFEVFKGFANTPGLVDYVCDYMASTRAPDVKEYITPSPVWSSDNRGGVWLMPAGRQEPAYASRLHSIDWHDLYTNREGFLMFEDMKAQWRTAVPEGFQYVLIDSRTGHTDVGGICTRQLPDAVVIMFFPNEQNLQGLTKVVNDIRAENQSEHRNRINLHFVLSNIPDLDDEDNILSARLERSRDMLKYKQDDCKVVHHYNSLSLLNQQIFVTERPKSKLTREYRDLVNAIMTANLEDPEGALSSLNRFQVQLSRAPINPPADLEEALSTIVRTHRNNAEILYRIATLRERMGRPEDALSVLDEAVHGGATSAQLFARRAHLHRHFRQVPEAVADAKKALEGPEVTGMDLTSSVRIIHDYDKPYLPQIPGAAAVRAQDVPSRFSIAQELMTSVEGLPSAERILRQILEDPKALEEFKTGAETYIVLCLIGQQRYQDAMETISSQRPKAQEISRVVSAFNYAMAEWGQLGVPPKDLFSRVIELTKPREGDANYLQCLALAYFIIGDRDRARQHLDLARREIRVNPRRSFSAWRYLEAAPVDFHRDLSALEQFIEGAGLVPTFMQPRRDLLSTLTRGNGNG
jgi:MinD-like ATPase involved in chromosome partitioning or flagellar assembly